MFKDKGRSGNARLYEVLEVQRTATAKEIRRAYRRLALRHHPDRGGESDCFREIAEAYDVLGDPESRKRYDMRGDQAINRLFKSAGASARNASDTYSSARPCTQPRTEDIVYTMETTLEQLYSGSVRKVAVEREVLDATLGLQKCIECYMRPSNSLGVCKMCQGRGTMQRTRRERLTLDVPIERGANDGQKVVFQSKANERQGWDTGDVVIILREKPHKEFQRHQADLYIQHTLTLSEALLGFSFDLIHLDGRKLRIKSDGRNIIRPKGALTNSQCRWAHFENSAYFELQDTFRMPSTSVEACKNICEERGFIGFVISNGEAVFHAVSRGEFIEQRQDCLGSDMYVAPDPERLASSRLQKAVRGEGMPSKGHPWTRGNLFVLFNIEFPRQLSAEALDVVREVLPSRLRDEKSADADSCKEFLLFDPGADGSDGFCDDECGESASEQMRCNQQ